MTETISAPIQDYLKAIYELSARHEAASTSALAERMGVTPASVTGMIQRLAAAEPPLVAYRKYQGVRLTPEGEREALKVIRSHRLLEAYLVQELGYSWDAVHEEACRLEHVISEDFERRIAEALGDPQRDPHGEPIPSTQLSMPEDDAIPLVELRPPQQGVIRRVEAEAADFLRYLETVGLVPEAQVEILDYSTFDQNIRLRLDGNELVLGPGVTGRIHVEVLVPEV